VNIGTDFNKPKLRCIAQYGHRILLKNFAQVESVVIKTFIVIEEATTLEAMHEADGHTGQLLSDHLMDQLNFLSPFFPFNEFISVFA